MIFPVDEVTNKYGNKYEAIIVAAKEGRKINGLRLAAGGAPEGAVKATVEGMRRVMNNDVTWHYVERGSEAFGAEPEE